MLCFASHRTHLSSFCSKCLQSIKCNRLVSNFCVARSKFVRRASFAAGSKSNDCSRFVDNDDRRSQDSHRFGSLRPKSFQLPSELADFMFHNLIYARDGIFCFSKPLGVSCYGVKGYGKFTKAYWKTGRKSIEEEEQHQNSEYLLTVESVLPDLSSMLNSPEPLQLMTTVPRYLSGPVLAVSSTNARKRVRTSVTKAYQAKQEFGLFKAVALCNGRFDQLSGGPILLHGKVVNVDGVGQYDLCPEEEAVSLSRTKQTRMGLCSDWFHFRVLSESGGCSLVEFTFNFFSRHLPRLFCLSQGAPILGDSLYQTRIAKILGQTVSVPLKNASIRNQYVDPEVLKVLKVSLRDYYKLPLFCHIIGMNLKELQGRQTEDVLIIDSIPEYFDTALRLLNLRDCIEEREDNSDCIEEKDDNSASHKS